uniref:Uncharacterized protein n=1 Tax=Vitis vinifera TaxID=29760 RepID=F6I4W2_VITVI
MIADPLTKGLPPKGKSHMRLRSWTYEIYTCGDCSPPASHVEFTRIMYLNGSIFLFTCPLALYIIIGQRESDSNVKF